MGDEYFSPNLNLPKADLLQDVTINGLPNTFTKFCKLLYNAGDYEKMVEECKSDTFFKSQYM